MTVDENLELSLQRGREYREDMARWLAQESVRRPAEEVGGAPSGFC